MTRPAVFKVTYQTGQRLKTPDPDRSYRNRDHWSDDRFKRLASVSGDAREVFEKLGEPAGSTFDNEGEEWITIGVRIRAVELITEFEP